MNKFICKNKKIIFSGWLLIFGSIFWFCFNSEQVLAVDATGCCKIKNNAEVLGCMDGKTELECESELAKMKDGLSEEWFEEKMCANLEDNGCVEKMDSISLQIPIKGVVKIDSYGQYINTIYQWMIGLASVLAVIMITISGFQWILSAGNPGKISKAKSQIINSLIAIAILAFSYLILATVNPNLLNLRISGVTKVASVPLEFSMPEIACNAPDMIPCGVTSVKKVDSKEMQACMGFYCEEKNDKASICYTVKRDRKYVSGKCVSDFLVKTSDNQGVYPTVKGNANCGKVFVAEDGVLSIGAGSDSANCGWNACAVFSNNNEYVNYGRSLADFFAGKTGNQGTILNTQCTAKAGDAGKEMEGSIMDGPLY